jgi:hypothetical protein
VSTVVRPVTVTAEVEVKSASKKLVTEPLFEEMGIMSKNVPRKIMAVKAAAISCVADSFGNFGISGSNYTPG